MQGKEPCLLEFVFVVVIVFIAVVDYVSRQAKVHEPNVVAE